MVRVEKAIVDSLSRVSNKLNSWCATDGHRQVVHLPSSIIVGFPSVFQGEFYLMSAMPGEEDMRAGNKMGDNESKSDVNCCLSI